MTTRFNDLYAQGKFADATAIAQQALKLAERRLGKEHPDTLLAIGNLALAHQATGRYEDAEALHKHVLEKQARLLGEDAPATLTSVNNLAVLYASQGRYGAAESLVSRSVEIQGRLLGREHPDTLLSVTNLAMLYSRQGRHSEAEPLLLQTLASRERVLGAEHADTLGSVSSLAVVSEAQGRYGEAERLHKRALDGRERVLGGEHPETTTSLANLAAVYTRQGRYREAEPLLRRAVDVQGRALGAEHPDTLLSVNNLAGLYVEQGRYAEAEPLFSRVLEVRERVLGANHPSTLLSANNLAALYVEQERYGDAEPFFKRALEARERTLGFEHPSTLGSLNYLAMTYQRQERFDEAELLHGRALDALERILGREHPHTQTSISNLASLRVAQGRLSEAKQLYERVMDARVKVLGAEHPGTLAVIHSLAHLRFTQRDWHGAAQLWRNGTEMIIRRLQRGLQEPRQALSGRKRNEGEQWSFQFRGLVKAAYRLAADGAEPDATVAHDMFQIVQWALSSEAARSLAQMAVRGAKGDAKLAALVRERQDLVLEWQKRDELRSAALAQDARDRKIKVEFEKNLAQLAAIDRRIAEIDGQLSASFPDYAALASIAALSVEDVQADLAADEALVLFVDTTELEPVAEETFVWVVTKTGIRWLRSRLGKAALALEVEALRCGLDHAASTSAHCPMPTIASDPSAALPFDHARAYKLYDALFGPVKDAIKGKHLLLVPFGPLTQLPFQVLVTAPPESSDNRTVAWLARGHALTILPSVSSLRALRRMGAPSRADQPFIGFGNTLLDGPDQGYAKLARLARDRAPCRDTPWEHSDTRFLPSRGITPPDLRGALANRASLLRQAPLPETADELCRVARHTGADVGQARLGDRATEREVKRLSEGGELARYRIVHFATHGAMAGDLRGLSEPGLILTPPAEATVEDDGYLSSAEIAGLKLDADWVILSACNTAAGSADNAEALSGLARSFFYAGARALLVSHWAVDSEATVTLITSAMREIANHPIGRAEALRRAMLALLDKGEAHQAHPAYWAPFVLVGEGAAR